MRAPIGLLAAGSVWLIVAINPLASSGYYFGEQAPHFMGLTVFSIVWVLASLALAIFFCSRRAWFSSDLLFHAFYLDQIQNTLVVLPAARVAATTSKADRKWIDGAIHALAYVHVTTSHLAGWWDRAIVDGAVNGVASLSRLIGSFTRSFQGGKIQLYLFWSVFAIVIFLIWSLI
jgi:NADH-quinone oxidoreductase subunit L